MSFTLSPSVSTPLAVSEIVPSSVLPDVLGRTRSLLMEVIGVGVTGASEESGGSGMGIALF